MPKEKPAPSKSKSTAPAAKAEAASAGAGTKAGGKAAAKVIANPRIVEAFRNLRDAKNEARTALVNLAEIAQNEQCTRKELVVSYMEAHGVELSTADTTVSRMYKLLSSPETLEKLKTGEIDLKTAREATVKKQTAPNEEKKKENAEKRYTKAMGSLVEAAKDLGLDMASIVVAVKAALKKAGV